MRTTPDSVVVEVPAVLAGVLAPADEIKELRAKLAAANAKLKADKVAAAAARAAAPKVKTARDYVREVDAAILGYAPNLLSDVPEALRAEVAQLIANQLHHLSSPSAGWVSDLPKPDRSEWR